MSKHAEVNLASKCQSVPRLSKQDKMRTLHNAVDRWYHEDAFTDISLLVCVGMVVGLNEISKEDIEWAQKVAQEAGLLP